MNTPGTSASGRAMATGPLLALCVLALLWGYNWVVMKIAMQYVGPMDFAALRGGVRYGAAVRRAVGGRRAVETAARASRRSFSACSKPPASSA